MYLVVRYVLKQKKNKLDKILFFFRNNLTSIESILLRGEGGIGSLQVGNRQSGSSSIPIILEMTEKQHKLCLRK